MVQKSGATSQGPGNSATKRSSATKRHQQLRSADKGSREVSATRRMSGKRGSDMIPPLHGSAHHAHLPPLSATQAHHTAAQEKHDDIKVIFLEDEITELKKTLKEEKHKNHYMQQLLEAAEKEKQKRQKELDRSEGALAAARAKEQEYAQEGLALAKNSAPLPFNASLNPLQVHLPAQAPRQPTLRECETIIRHLQHVGDKQAHELNQLKSDLRDVLYSHKWTPDAYLLAKAYIADDDAKETAETGKLPKVALKHNTRKLPDIAYIQKDALSLPPLRTGVGNQAVERRKRTQILQKAKMRREIDHVDV